MDVHVYTFVCRVISLHFVIYRLSAIKLKIEACWVLFFLIQPNLLASKNIRSCGTIAF